MSLDVREIQRAGAHTNASGRLAFTVRQARPPRGLQKHNAERKAYSASPSVCVFLILSFFFALSVSNPPVYASTPSMLSTWITLACSSSWPVTFTVFPSNGFARCESSSV